jgi:hypothetical protein
METKGGNMKSRHIPGKHPLTRKIEMIVRTAVVLLLLLTLANCQHTYYQTPLRTRSARTLYPAALRKALGWRPDAYLESIVVDVLPRDDDSQRVQLRFHFQSPSDDRYSLSVSFQGDSDEMKIKQYSHEMAISVHNPINSEDWPLDSVDVLPIAQANGGDEFLAGRNLEVMLMSLHLQRWSSAPGVLLQWRAIYFDSLTDDRLDVMVNSQTGKITGTERSPSH